MWLIVLSDQLPIVALVGLYPTNQLIGRGLISRRLLPGFPSCEGYAVLSAISRRYSSPQGRCTHVFLTRPPLPARKQDVRLACVRHAASVYPEPGSNSPSKMYMQISHLMEIHVFSLVTSLSNSLTGFFACFIVVLTTLQLFRCYLCAFASVTLSGFPSGAREIISSPGQPVKRFFYEFSKSIKTHSLNGKMACRDY